MIINAEYIEQPYDGEYREDIYDIKNVWNSSDWIWIKFTDENDEWCGEFRGTYRGVSISNKLGIIVVLTSDHMYMLDIHNAQLIGYLSQPAYVDITASPSQDIFITDGYCLEMFTANHIEARKSIPLPIRPDSLRFTEWKGNILKMTCYEFWTWEDKELFWDSVTLQWIDHA